MDFFFKRLERWVRKRQETEMTEVFGLCNWKFGVAKGED